MSFGLLKIGIVTNYYEKIGMCLVELSFGLAVGDTIRFGSGENAIEQKIDAIQINHKQVEFAQSGSVVGLKVQKLVEVGSEVFKNDI